MLACLPPATLPPTSETAAEQARDPTNEPGRCRALIGELDEAGRYTTRELHWDSEGVHEAQREGLIVGDADTLFELTLERRAYEASELYGDAPVRCEEQRVMLRKLPDGVARPLISARPACAGTVDGEQVALESSLQIVSVLGPYLGWREEVEGPAPEPTSLLDYRTLDVRNGHELDAKLWLLEPTPTMVMAAGQLGHSCERDDAPPTTSAIDGFAIRWSDLAGPRLLVGYPCCAGRSCELDEWLPKVDAELATQLPDPDRLLHSPYGCGSIGLNGQLRTRDGAAVGRIELDATKLISLVFVPADHPFEIGW